MHKNIEKAGAYGALALLGLFGVFFWAIANFIPPLSPGASADAIARTYAEHNTRIRVGLGLIVLFASITFPFVAVLARQVRRIEGYWGVMSLSQLGAGIVIPIGFIFPSVVGIAAGFRTHRSPEITQALNDVFWLMFVGIVGTLVLQAIILAIATFIDKREHPVFPRWFGYMNVWYAVLALPGCAIYLFHDGPLAWNGVFAFWIPLAAFTGWVVSVTVVLVRAVDSEAAAES